MVKSDLFHTGDMVKTCDWVKTDPAKYCGSDYEGPKHNCPLLCGLCEDDSVTLAPSSVDTITHTSASPSASPFLESPSLLPSAAPTFNNAYACDVSKVYGGTIYVRPNDNTCMKLEVFSGGAFYINPHVPQGEPCGSIFNYIEIGSFDASDSQSNELFYTMSGKHGWDAEFTLTFDPTLSSTQYHVSDEDVFSRQLEAILIFPSCPTALSSTIPSSMSRLAPTAAVPRSSNIPPSSRLLNTLPSAVVSSIPTNSPTLVPGSSRKLMSGCNVQHPEWIGDGYCDDDSPGYFTKECEWDGGDCDSLKELYKDCPGPLAWLGDGECDEYESVDGVSLLSLNTVECGNDLGDCKGIRTYRRNESKRRAKMAALDRITVVAKAT